MDQVNNNHLLHDTKLPELKLSYFKQILHKIIREEHVPAPHGREWTRPLHMLLAVQRQIQSLSHWYATSTQQCYMRSIRYTALSDSLPPKKRNLSLP